MTTTPNTTPTSGAADLLAMVSKALREAYNLGQRYWQQADSEYISQHKKADDTRAKFLALVEETCATLAAGQATAAPAQPAAQQGAADGFFLLLPQRPKPEAPAGTAGLDWAAYSGAQMLAFGRDCSDAAIAAIRTEQPAPATQQAGIPGNFITHRAAWREALETAKFVSTGVDRSYWDHELAAFDRSFDRLWTLMQDAARKQGANHDR